MNLNRLVITTIAACALAFNAIAEVKVGEAAPDFTGTDSKGATQTLSAYKGKVVVLEWTNPQCPFVKKFYDVGRMQRFQKVASMKSVVWLSINSSAAGKEGSMIPTEAEAWIGAQKATPAAYIIDSTSAIAKLYGAKTTPHMFVIDKEGKVAYMGAMDDKPSTNPEDLKGAKNYVTAAIDSLTEGKPVAVSSTTPYGCGVKYADEKKADKKKAKE